MKLLNALSFFLVLTAHTTQSATAKSTLVRLRKSLQSGGDNSDIIFIDTPESNGPIPSIDFDGLTSFIGTYVAQNIEFPGTVPITDTSVTNHNPESCSVTLVDDACAGASLDIGQTCSVGVQVTPLADAAGTSCTSTLELIFPVRGSPLTDSFTVTAITVAPSMAPSEMPSITMPTTDPSMMPTDAPTAEPTFVPTDAPTLAPTMDPSMTPSFVPTNALTGAPTSNTQTPSFRSTMAPSNGVGSESPTVAPNGIPAEDTHAPSTRATLAPSDAANTRVPSQALTQMPTLGNQTVPSQAPTRKPTDGSHINSMDDDHNWHHPVYVISIVIPVCAVIVCCLAAMGCYYQNQNQKQRVNSRDSNNSDVSEPLLLQEEVVIVDVERGAQRQSFSDNNGANLSRIYSQQSSFSGDPALSDERVLREIDVLMITTNKPNVLRSSFSSQSSSQSY